MTPQEMSDYFDVVLQAHVTKLDNSEIDPLVFDEYEKSVFLTSSQEDMVSALYNKSGNFEFTEEDRRLLNNLVRSDKPVLDNTTMRFHITNNSKFYILPDDLMYIIHEQCTMNSNDPCIASRIFDVYPCTHDEFNRTNRNPFRGTNDHRVLRLDYGLNVVELVSDYTIKDYTIRYIKHPAPIVLLDLTNTGLTIDNVNTVSACELGEQLHKRIVEYAVKKALLRKSINFKDK